MKITRRSMFTGQMQSMDLDITREEVGAWLGVTVHEGNAVSIEGPRMLDGHFARLAPPEREFLKTGVTPAEWKAEFGAECTVEGCTCRFEH